MLWPNAFSVGSPWTPSRNSEPNAFSACWRSWLLRRSFCRKTVGAINVTSAKTSITAATGTSQKAMKTKIAKRRQHRDRQLRHVLAEKGLQLLDAVDDRQHDPAGALAGEPGRPQLGELVVEAAAQILLHAVGGAVRDHGALLLDRSRAG